MEKGDESANGIPAELLKRLDAAKDENGVITDAALADEYFAALQAANARLDQSQLDKLPPSPQPEPVFPNLDSSGDALDG